VAADRQAEREGLASAIPADWDETYKAFSDLVKAENTARLTFWRSAEGAYETALMGPLSSTSPLLAMTSSMMPYSLAS